MKTRVEKLTAAYEPLQATVAGNYLFKALLGFAEVLDNSENAHEIDTDLVDIYLMLGFKNGTTMQLTGQITDLYIEKEGTQTNIVRLSLEDRKTGVMPNTIFIFSLNEIYTIQSLDVVTHQRKLAERYAAEDRAELVPTQEGKVECQSCYADGKTPSTEDCAKCDSATPNKKEAKDDEEV